MIHGMNALKEQEFYACHYVNSSFHAFLDGIKLFSNGGYGSVEASISLMFKGWERLWQASRIINNNGHIVAGKGDRFYALYDFLNELQAQQNPVAENPLTNRKDFAFKKECTINCSPCDDCNSLCAQHVLYNQQCECEECQGWLDKQCKNCGNFEHNCIPCELCSYTLNMSANSGGHAPSSIVYYGMNPMLLHGSMSELSFYSSPFTANLILLKNLRNIDIHGYIESSFLSNISIAQELYPYILSNIYSYLETFMLVYADLPLKCDTQCAKRKTQCALLDLNENSVIYAYSSITLPINLKFVNGLATNTRQKLVDIEKNSKNSYLKHIKKEINKSNAIVDAQSNQYHKYKMDFSVFNSEIDIEKIINKAEDGSKNIKNLIGRIFSPKVINNTDTFDLAVSVLKEITAEYPDTGNSFKKDFNITISDELYELLLTKKDVAVKMYEKRKKAS